MNCIRLPPLDPASIRNSAVRRRVGAGDAPSCVRADRLALVGHSRGAGEATLKYLLANGNVQAAVPHSWGYAASLAARRGIQCDDPAYAWHGGQQRIEQRVSPRALKPVERTTERQERWRHSRTTLQTWVRSNSTSSSTMRAHWRSTRTNRHAVSERLDCDRTVIDGA